MATINNTVNTNFSVEGNVDSSFEKLQNTVQRFDNSTDNITNNFRQIARTSKASAKEVNLFEKTFGRLNFAVKAFVAFELSRTFSDIVFGIGNTIAEAQRLEAQLISLTGSAEQASRTFDALSGLALSIPGTDTNQLVQAFNQLRNLNLDTSRGSLEDLADLAAGLGRPLPRLIEAIADASTFEFERLKEEFGIVARAIDDQIQITFRGTTTTIEKSAASLQGFLRDIAQDEFAGAAENQLDTVGAAWTRFVSVLKDGVVEIDEVTKASGLLGGVLNAVTEGIRDARDLETVFEIDEQIEKTQKAFDNYGVSLQRIRRELDEGIIDQRTADRRSFTFLQGQRQLTNELNSLAEERARAAQKLAETNRALVPENDVIQRIVQANNTLLGEADKFIAKNKEQEDLVVRLTRAYNELNSLPPTLRFTSDNQAALDRLNQAIIGAIEARDKIADTEANKAFARVLPDLLNANLTDIEVAARKYEDAIQSIKNASDKAIEDSGLVRADLIARASKQFSDALDKIVGEPVIRGVTSRSIQAFREQRALLDQAVRQFGEGIRDRFANSELELIEFGLEESILEQRRTLLEPAQRFFAELTDLRANYNATIKQVNQDLIAEDEELRQRLFLRDFSVDLVGLDTFAEKINAVKQSFSSLADQGFDDSLVGEEEQRRLERILTLREQFIEDLLELETQDLFNAIRDGRAQDLTDEEVYLRNRIALSAQAASNILGIWSENSRGLFELQKALDIGIIANNASVAISEAIASFGANPFLGGLKLAGLIAQFAGLVQDVTNRSFGDGSISGAGANGFSARDAQPQNLFNSQGGGNTINIYGNILDNNAFRRTVVDTIKEAGQRDELTVDDFVERRF